MRLGVSHIRLFNADGDCSPLFNRNALFNVECRCPAQNHHHKGPCIKNFLPSTTTPSSAQLVQLLSVCLDQLPSPSVEIQVEPRVTIIISFLVYILHLHPHRSPPSSPSPIHCHPVPSSSESLIFVQAPESSRNLRASSPASTRVVTQAISTKNT